MRTHEKLPEVPGTTGGIQQMLTEHAAAPELDDGGERDSSAHQ